MEELLMFIGVVIATPLAIGLGVALAFTRGELRRLRAEREPRAAREEARLDRLEQAVDAIAVEVERLAQNQQFTTRLLTEGRRRDEG